MMYPWFPHAICQECDYMISAKRCSGGVFAFYHPTADELPPNVKSALVEKFKNCPNAGKWFSYPPLQHIGPPEKMAEVRDGEL